MDAQKVLLDVVGPIKQLEADITVEGLVVLVDVLMPMVQVSAVRGVRATWADIPLLCSQARRSRSCYEPAAAASAIGCLSQVLQIL